MDARPVVENEGDGGQNTKSEAYTPLPKSESAGSGGKASADASTGYSRTEPTPRRIVEAFEGGRLGSGVPQGFFDLCHIDSELADGPILPGSALWIFGDIIAKHEQARRLREAGWIPHPVIPIGDLIGPEKDSERIRMAVTEYVAAHREEIYANLLNPHFLFEVQVNDRMIEPTLVFMRF